MLRFRRGIIGAVYKLWNIPHIRLLCLAVLLVMVSFVYLASQTPMSKLYKKYHPDSQILEHAKNLNVERLQKANVYFDRMKTSSTSNSFRNLPVVYRDPTLVVCIISARRVSTDTSRSGYLIQTAAVMDHVIKQDKYFEKSIFFVCNVDKQPDGHHDAVQLQSHIHYVRKYGDNSFNKTFRRFDHFRSNHEVKARGKETEDYIYCMNVSHSFGAPYVLMLEDDVLPYRNVFRVLNYTLTAHKLHSKGRQYSFLKLHYPERWQGFAYEMDRLLELFSVSVLGGVAIYSIIVTCSRHNVNNLAKSFYMVFGTFATMVCVSLIGRQYLMDLRRIHPQLFKFTPAAHCCTPAMLYNNDVIPGLITYLMDHSAKNKDLAIYDFTEEASVPGYQLEPNLFRHIGLYTSLGDGHKPPEEFLFNLNV